MLTGPIMRLAKRSRAADPGPPGNLDAGSGALARRAGPAWAAARALGFPAALAALLAIGAPAAQAADLMDVWRAAQGNDLDYAAAASARQTSTNG